MSKSISDIYRGSYYESSGLSYVRAKLFSLIDDGSISDLALPDLIRRSYFDDGVNTYLRTSIDSSLFNLNPAIHDEIISSDLTIDSNKQYLLYGALTVDYTIIADGDIVVI